MTDVEAHHDQLQEPIRRNRPGTKSSVS